MAWRLCQLAARVEAPHILSESVHLRARRLGAEPDADAASQPGGEQDEAVGPSSLLFAPAANRNAHYCQTWGSNAVAADVVSSARHGRLFEVVLAVLVPQDCRVRVQLELWPGSTKPVPTVALGQCGQPDRDAGSAPGSPVPGADPTRSPNESSSSAAHLAAGEFLLSPRSLAQQPTIRVRLRWTEKQAILLASQGYSVTSPVIVELAPLRCPLWSSLAHNSVVPYAGNYLYYPVVRSFIFEPGTTAPRSASAPGLNNAVLASELLLESYLSFDIPVQLLHLRLKQLVERQQKWDALHQAVRIANCSFDSEPQAAACGYQLVKLSIQAATRLAQLQRPPAEDEGSLGQARSKNALSGAFNNFVQSAQRAARRGDAVLSSMRESTPPADGAWPGNGSLARAMGGRSADNGSGASSSSSSKLCSPFVKVSFQHPAGHRVFLAHTKTEYRTANPTFTQVVVDSPQTILADLNTIAFYVPFSPDVLIFFDLYHERKEGFTQRIVHVPMMSACYPLQSLLAMQAEQPAAPISLDFHASTTHSVAAVGNLHISISSNSHKFPGLVQNHGGAQLPEHECYFRWPLPGIASHADRLQHDIAVLNRLLREARHNQDALADMEPMGTIANPDQPESSWCNLPPSVKRSVDKKLFDVGAIPTNLHVAFFILEIAKPCAERAEPSASDTRTPLDLAAAADASAWPRSLDSASHVGLQTHLSEKGSRADRGKVGQARTPPPPPRRPEHSALATQRNVPHRPVDAHYARAPSAALPPPPPPASQPAAISQRATTACSSTSSSPAPSPPSSTSSSASASSSSPASAAHITSTVPVPRPPPPPYPPSASSASDKVSVFRPPPPRPVAPQRPPPPRKPSLPETKNNSSERCGSSVYGVFPMTTCGAPAAHCFGFEKSNSLVRERDTHERLARSLGKWSPLDPDQIPGGPDAGSKSEAHFLACLESATIWQRLFMRETVVLSQAVSALSTCFLSEIIVRLGRGELAADHLSRWRPAASDRLGPKVEACQSWILQLHRIGFLVGWESLVSSQGKELGMLEDSIDVLSQIETKCRIRIVSEHTWRAEDVDLHSNRKRHWLGDGRKNIHVDLQIVEDKIVISFVLARPDFEQFVGNAVGREDLERGIRVVPALFTQGINETQTFANIYSSVIGDSTGSSRQMDLNNASLERVEQYYRSYCGWKASAEPDEFRAEEILLAQTISDTRTAVRSQRGGQKEVQVLISAANAVRALNGGRVTFCKSGKDRTAMSITLEQTRLLTAMPLERRASPLFDDAQIANMFREFGGRIVVAEKNVGRPKYSFNAAQRQLLPVQYRPPPSTIQDFFTSVKARDS